MSSGYYLSMYVVDNANMGLATPTMGRKKVTRNDTQSVQSDG